MKIEIELTDAVCPRCKVSEPLEVFSFERDDSNIPGMADGKDGNGRLYRLTGFGAPAGWVESPLVRSGARRSFFCPSCAELLKEAIKAFVEQTPF